MQLLLVHLVQVQLKLVDLEPEDLPDDFFSAVQSHMKPW